MPRKRKPSVAKATKGKRGRPHKKTSAQKVRQPQKVITLSDRIRSVRWSESYTSLLMGLVVVIVAALFIVSFIKQTKHIQQTSSTSTVAVETITPTVTGEPTLQPAEKTYTVKPGDDLWHISEKFYKSGYNWVDIAKANKLSDPSTIHSGNKLIIPSVTPQVAIITVTPTPIPSVIPSMTITGTTYTVQKGDDLWHIAVRAYADGYQWVKIAQANNLSNPNLIFSGNVLKIPR